jgi:hypothetical protein
MQHKTDIPNSTLRDYVSPWVRVIPLHPENAICDSPVPGGNEDIGYEDWD